MKKQFDPAAFGTPLSIFSFVVPTDYDSKTQIDTFRAQVEHNAIFFQPKITSASFPGPSYQFVPGKRYEIKIWPFIGERAFSGEECLAFLEHKNSLLTGAHGLSLFHQFAPNLDVVPEGMHIASFDKKESLLKGEGTLKPVDGSYHCVPSSMFRLHTGQRFFLCAFEEKVFGRNCGLLDFRLVES